MGLGSFRKVLRTPTSELAIVSLIVSSISLMIAQLGVVSANVVALLISVCQSFQVRGLRNSEEMMWINRKTCLRFSITRENDLREPRDDISSSVNESHRRGA